MPRKVFKTTTAPEGVLCRRHWKLFQDVAHEPPALEIGELRKVTEQTCEVHPDQRIDTRDVSPAKTKIDPARAGPEHAHALSGKPAEVDVVGRARIAFRGQVRDE